MSTVGRVALLLASFASAPSWTRAQSPDSAAVDAMLRDDLRRIHAAALTSSYAYRQLAYLSDSIGPRMNGSPAGQRAVEYVAAEMRRLGLAVRLEPVTVPHWVRGKETAELVEWPSSARGQTRTVTVTALGGSVATAPAGLTAEVIVVRDVSELQRMGRERIAGKIVLFDRRFDERMAQAGYAEDAYNQVAGNRGLGPSEAERLGAVAALVRSIGPAGSGLHTGGMRAAGIPAAAVTSESADLIGRLASRGRIRLRLTLTPQSLPDVVTWNVIGDLVGSEHPEEIVIVSGHLDSWDLGTGALDDGAGVAMALETAQLLARLNLRPKRTIRVIAWAAEEIGLLGAKAYAQQHEAELDAHAAAVESDAGVGHAVGFLMHAGARARRLLAPATEVLESSGANLIKTEGDPAPDLGRLRDVGVPAFLLLVDERKFYDYHHTRADRLGNVAPSELAEDAAAVAVLTYTLATIPQTLPRVR